MKKKRIGKVQGFALLYGRSSRAVRIVNGEEVGGVVKQHHPTNRKRGGRDKQVEKKPMIGAKVNAVDNLHRSAKNNSRSEKQVQKKYKMDESIERKLDSLQDPLDMMSRHARTQKYEEANSTEKYEYGLSDW